MNTNQTITNQELFEKFEEIFNLGNPFDIEMAIRDFQKDYRNSEYYNATRHNIKVAYKQFIKFKATQIIKEASAFISIPGIVAKIDTILQKVDMTILDAALDRLSGGIDVASVEKLQGDLNKSIGKLRKK